MARLGTGRYLTYQIYRTRTTVSESLTYRFVAPHFFISTYFQQIPRYLVYVLHFGKSMCTFYEMVRYSDTNWILQYRNLHQQRTYQPDQINVLYRNIDLALIPGAMMINRVGILTGHHIYSAARTYVMFPGETKVTPYAYTDLPTLITDMIKMLTRPKRPYADSVYPISDKIRIFVQSSSDSLSPSDSDSDHSPTAEDSSLPVM